MQETKKDHHAGEGDSHLERRFGLLQSTALNMSNMIGIGPFITIPLLMTALMGPQSLIGWLLALLITIPDSLIWSELGAAMPGSGGTYVYLKEAYGPRKWGRFMAFMFIWQFILSGPLEIASGYIGFVQYLGYVWPNMTVWQTRMLVIVLGVLTIALLYRKIGSIGKITVSLWIGTLLTTGIVIVLGALNFDPKLAFSNPFPNIRYIMPTLTVATKVMAALAAVVLVVLFFAIRNPKQKTSPGVKGFLVLAAAGALIFMFSFDPQSPTQMVSPGAGMALGFMAGLGAAARIGVYDFLGYYDICYIGDEVKNPGKVIPRSILMSLIFVSLIYIGINLSIMGVVPMNEFVPAGDNPKANFIVSIFMERLVGPKFATFFTFLVMWTAFGSVFALMLGYSRIPFAAAQDGYFFSIFGKTHPTKKFPHVSLLLIGIISIVCSFFSLGAVIDALIAARILVQFIGQIFAVVAIRKTRPDMAMPFKMWLYPLPCLLALLGWTFLFATTPRNVKLYALAFIAAGVVGFLIWAANRKSWPFGAKEDEKLATDAKWA